VLFRDVSLGKLLCDHLVDNCQPILNAQRLPFPSDMPGAYRNILSLGFVQWELLALSSLVVALDDFLAEFGYVLSLLV
jgi:hypothetical protein